MRPKKSNTISHVGALQRHVKIVSHLGLVHAEPIALQLINHITPVPSNFRRSHLGHVRPAHRMPSWLRQPASIFWVFAIREFWEYSASALHDTATPSRKSFHPLCGVEPAPPAEPKLTRLRQRVRARKLGVCGSLPSRLALEDHQLSGQRATFHFDGVD